MTEAQVAELDQALTTALKSSTIEWAANLRICDMLEANPSLAPTAMHRLESRLRKDSPVPVLLALSLLEMVVKNCGLSACRFIDAELSDSLVSLVKKREGWRYGFGRNLHKSGMASWLPEGAGIGEEERRLWWQASQKVLEMLQLWTDAFLLQEAQLHPIFDAYKRLRQEGYKFRRGDHGTSEGLCLVHGAEESPAYLAGAYPAASGEGGAGDAGAAVPARMPSAAGGGRPEAQGGAAAESLTATGGSSIDAGQGSQDEEAPVALPAEADAVRRLLREARSVPGDSALLDRLQAARTKVTHLIERHAEAEAAGAEQRLEGLFELLDELSEALAASAPPPVAPGAGPGAGGGGSALAAVPPPPSEAPPGREQQELYDLILARYLQERENQAPWASEEEDAALARRLAMEEGGGGDARPARGMVSCVQCDTVNQLQGRLARGPRSELFMCYACGLTQRVPAAASHVHLAATGGRRSQSGEARPVLHAPPARVICAAGAAPELLITAGAVDAALAESSRPLTTSSGSSGLPRPEYAFASGTQLSQGLLGGSGEQGGEAPLVGRAVKSLAKSVGSWVPASGVGHAKRLGDGMPEGEYAELQGDDATASLVGGAPPGPRGQPRKTGSSKPHSLAWRSRTKSQGDAGESLLGRVHVTGDWELIRPADGRPYWHNSATAVSQWEPPEVVRQSM